jgi:hypothetical protein
MFDLILYEICNEVPLHYSADEDWIIFYWKLNYQNKMWQWLKLLHEAFDLWKRYGDGGWGGPDSISEFGNE